MDNVGEVLDGAEHRRQACRDGMTRIVHRSVMAHCLILLTMPRTAYQERFLDPTQHMPSAAILDLKSAWLNRFDPDGKSTRGVNFGLRIVEINVLERERRLRG